MDVKIVNLTEDRREEALAVFAQSGWNKEHLFYVKAEMQAFLKAISMGTFGRALLRRLLITGSSVSPPGRRRCVRFGCMSCHGLRCYPHGATKVLIS